MRILLIEDDILIGDGLLHGLHQLGMAVDWFRSGKEGKAALAQAPYDAVVLDLGLPEIDGMAILQSWRTAQLFTPVLILTARDALENRLAGLNAGADDYLIKPFSLEEVAARLNALVRRNRGSGSAKIDYGALQLDSVARTATLHGKTLDLTAREWTLLALFVSSPGRILTRGMIEEKLYSWDQDIESNAIEVHIHHLRKKVGNRFIHTKRRLGYVLGDKP